MSTKASIVYTDFPDGRGGMHLYEEQNASRDPVYLDIAVEQVEVASHPNGHFWVKIRLPKELIDALADGTFSAEVKKWKETYGQYYEGADE